MKETEKVKVIQILDLDLQFVVHLGRGLVVREVSRFSPSKYIR